MPRKDRKKFRKFLASRRNRLAHLYDDLAAHQTWRGDILRALRVPVLMLAVYGLLWSLGLFSFLYAPLHGVAAALWLIWVVQAVRGALGFWSHRAHLRFFLPIAALIAFGACWGGVTSPAAKAWVTPPSYAHVPAEQLSGKGGPVQVLEGSLLQISWQGVPEVLTAHFNGKEEKLDIAEEGAAIKSFVVPMASQKKALQLFLWRGWRRLGLWSLEIKPDEPPQISLTEDPELTVRKSIRFAYEARDDYGVETVSVRLAPTTAQKGMPTEPIEIPLEQPAAKQIKTASYIDLTSLPWAGLPVTVQLIATDGAGHRAGSLPKVLALPTRTFHNPFARALIEERQKLLGQPDIPLRDEAANIMAGIARQQGLYHGDKVVMMALRAGAVRLVLSPTPETVASLAPLLWQTALRLEEGDMGRARGDLAEAERDLSLALMREPLADEAMMYWLRLQETMTHYFDVLEAERARQPPALQELDWPLATAQEMLYPEDLQNRLGEIGVLLKKGSGSEAREQLARLQKQIENLRTTPPDLTPAQAQLAQQISALRALVRGQKSLNEESAPLLTVHPVLYKEHKALATGVARALAQQQLLLAALREVIGQTTLSTEETKAAAEAMRRAAVSLQKKEMKEAGTRQEEALALLQNTLLTLSDQIKRSLAAKAPEK
ncbi:MAG: DUF4175 family protein [Bdellovibrionales bacterium]